MHEDMHSLLNAYLDGELHGRSLHEMETHLASCGDCQDELRELRQVSELLQADPVTDALPVERFVSQMTLRLPRRSPTNPVGEARFAGLVARPGRIVWNLDLCSDGIHPYKRSKRCERKRTAGQRIHLAGRRAGIHLAERSVRPVWRTAHRPATALAAEQRERIWCQPGWRVPFAGRDRSFISCLAKCLVDPSAIPTREDTERFKVRKLFNKGRLVLMGALPVATKFLMKEKIS